ncbi:6a60ad9e-f1c4-447c-8c08-589766b8a816 [Sclerotinia trifoliorum]|uniref:6a60ad9e-f1c4-447c-8c08-589766b8a816 n=1 Tax=Sclerotinia trifoliorum TaxID=28548 RepID=A0A8H2VMU2_9HELO|nr:6a60ad9e-f1c4-447c-8c08-589766b8a816 [Sclerotinia trifoliorum]
MPSFHPETFSSNRKFEVYTNTYPLIPGLVLVGWYIKIPNLKSGMPDIQSSGDAAAIEATQELVLRRSGQHIRIGKHGIMLLSGMLYDYQRMKLSTDEDDGREMRSKDRRVSSTKISEDMKKDHTRHINLLARNLIQTGCLEWPRYWAACKRPSIFDKKTIETERVTLLKPSRRPYSYGCCKEYNEAPPTQQEKVPPGPSKAQITIDQQTPQISAQQDHHMAPLTLENLSVVSGGHKTQVCPRSHKSRRSGTDIERVHHKGIQTADSADKKIDIQAPSTKRPHSRRAKVISLYGEDSDPGSSKQRFAPPWHDMHFSRKSSISSDYPATSDSGLGSSVASTTSRFLHASSSFKPKARLDLNVGGRDIHVLHGPGRTYKPSSDDGYETEYNIKVRKPKKQLGPNHVAAMAV